MREFEWTPEIEPWEAGDFGNYIEAAAQTVGRRWGIGGGFDGCVSSTIPAAAGLSSSSALVIAATLALLRMRGVPWDFTELMEVLPEGEMYVGTRGGGMDHAVCLAGRAGCALRIEFNPVSVRPKRSRRPGPSSSPTACDWRRSRARFAKSITTGVLCPGRRSFRAAPWFERT